MAYIPGMQGYVFHGGYCVVNTDDGELCGLMDKKGNLVLPMEYRFICPSNDFTMWVLIKDEEQAVVDSKMKPIFALKGGSIHIGEGTIDVTLPDHTMRKYDKDGTLINDFCISSVRMLDYEEDEIVHWEKTVKDEDDNIVEEQIEYYHPKATARLRAYIAGDGYEGLMTADGRIVTMPLYEDIEAIAYDLYLCSSTYRDKVIVNGKGEIVK